MGKIAWLIAGVVVGAGLAYVKFIHLPKKSQGKIPGIKEKVQAIKEAKAQ